MEDDKNNYEQSLVFINLKEKIILFNLFSIFLNFFYLKKIGLDFVVIRLVILLCEFIFF